MGHTLSVITLKSELAAKLLTHSTENRGESATRAAAEIRDVERISRDALAEVRSAVRGYRAEDLSADLGSAKVMLKAAGIQLETAINPITLTSDQERTLAFALREAVTNVVRHSGASRCAIRLTGLDGEVCLEVEDDGVGDWAGVREGSGLRGMRERLKPLGGRLERDTATGTRLRIYLPRSPKRPEASLGASSKPAFARAESPT